MGLIETLHDARAAFERREWLSAYEGLSSVDEDMAAADYADLAAAAFLVGRFDDCVLAFSRAHQAYLDANEPERAALCACHLTNVLVERGEVAVSGGWLARAERLLDRVPPGSLAQGYVAFARFRRSILDRDLTGAAGEIEVALDVAERQNQPELLSLALMGQGRAEIYSGRIDHGLRRLDEAMVGVLAGELPPISAGEVYCSAIEACQEISDYGRMGEWTEALSAWCAHQPELVAFTGQCALHRGQLMRFRGALADARNEFEASTTRYAAEGRSRAVGYAHAGAAEASLRLGDEAAATVALERAREAGYDAPVEVALASLMAGRLADAGSAAQRLVERKTDPARRSRMLPAIIEILLAVEAFDQARVACAELGALADRFGTPALRAHAARAQGDLALREGDAGQAQVPLRKAVDQYGRLGCAYEAAMSRRSLAEALDMAGDASAAQRERDAADHGFRDGLQRSRPGGLTQRECEVLRHVAEGASNRQIAQALHLSEKTVARHLSNIFGKLDVQSRTAAAAFAFAHGLAGPR